MIDPHVARRHEREPGESCCIAAIILGRRTNGIN
jgi:hypothetical protein